jgi:hypothetical protein
MAGIIRKVLVNPHKVVPREMLPAVSDREQEYCAAIHQIPYDQMVMPMLEARDAIGAYGRQRQRTYSLHTTVDSIRFVWIWFDLR